MIDLVEHRDNRGTFTELFRVEWTNQPAPLQWNRVCSNQHVLRGVHVHPTHFDYLTLVEGQASIGLQDIRPNSPTTGLASVIELNGQHQQLIVIPPGVAHGFYFHQPSIHVYAVSHYFNQADELGCQFNDPAIKIPWTVPTPMLSERDQKLPSFQEMLAAWLAATGGLGIWLTALQLT